MAEALRVERPSDGVVLLTLALPERRNAMTEELTTAWTATIADLAQDRSVRAVVVTGEGRAFCAGGDLSWIDAGASTLEVGGLRDRMLAFYRAWLSVRDLEVPVLAAVNGPAVGAGLCLALACDLRYAGESARLSAPFTALGIHPGMAATYLLVEACGMVVARDLLYTGRVVHAEEAKQLGLVNGVFPDGSLVADTITIAEQIAAAAPLATRLVKAGLARGTAGSIEDALAWEGLAQPVTMLTKDKAEASAAMAAKRPPVFTGR